jgi:hypothetical protein
MTLFNNTTRLTACALALTLTVLAADQTGHKITSPKEALGFDIGDDYHLASYTGCAGRSMAQIRIGNQNALAR